MAPLKGRDHMMLAHVDAQGHVRRAQARGPQRTERAGHHVPRDVRPGPHHTEETLWRVLRECI